MDRGGITGFEDIKTSDPTLIHILKMAGRIARSDSNVLITGESGTGKELVARGIHRLSNRSTGPFVAVNCGAIPEGLLESELMGYERGAFTGAISRKIGDFESANGGTIFLDEIGTLPLALQAKLLRVIQEKEIKRIGSTRSIKLNVRIISATNEDLRKRVEQDLFRQDLYFRLNVIPIHLPPLRDRMGDIPLLLEHFTGRFCKILGTGYVTYSDEARNALLSYRWPGNVRELENMVERLIVLHGHKKRIELEDLPENIISTYRKGYPPFRMGHDSLRERCLAYEREEILRVLDMTGWNRIKAARVLKMHRNTLWMKMKRYGISPKRGKGLKKDARRLI